MLLEPPALRRQPAVDGSVYEEPGADTEAIDELLAVQSRAFGLPGSAQGWAGIIREGLRSGVFFAGLARDAAGRVVSTALLLGDGRVAELAGVGTLPEARGQGLGGMVSAELAATGFGAGLHLIWLSADAEAIRVYERVGFRRAGTQLNFESPERD
jgi:ribosomal protein S18 acetylase RimI-like enzyme